MMPDPSETGDKSVQLAFSFDEESKGLQAVLSPAETAFEMDLNTLKVMIEQQGYSAVDTDDATLLDILRKARKGETGSFDIGKIEPQLSVSFEYDPQTRKLHALLEQSDSLEAISFNTLKQKLEKEGFGDFDVTSTALSDLVLKAQHKKTGRHPIGDKPEYTSAKFTLNEETNELLADLAKSEEKSIRNRSDLNDLLAAQNYSDFYLEPGILDKLYGQISNNERGQFVVGAKRDALIDITFDDELMTAFISVSPPMGGRDLDQSLLDVALANASVYRECCDDSILATILEEKTASNLKFANGSEPVDGVDATFEALVQEVEYSKPKETKTGKIDLREIINFTLVEADTPLMRRTPAKPGVNGRNVKGQVIPAIEGDDTPFDEELAGANVSEKDPNLLVSTCKGHPVIATSGVRVDNTIIVNNVDMSTGNITYDGSVLVKGEVKAGMKIKVSGDIIVKGVVSKATLQARNNITVECGIIGSDPTKDGESSPPAILKAGGNIEAQYINLAEVHAGQDVVIREYISHCNVEAKQQILAGKKGGKGRIFGGSVYGRAGIFANAIGANGGVKTTIIAGIPIQQQKQFEQLVKSHDNRVTQSKQLSGILKKYKEALAASPQDIEKAQKANSVKKVLSEIRAEIEKMSATIQQLNKVFKSSQKAEVSISKETFPNVVISINGAEFFIRQESKGGIFVKQGSDIRWLNYK